MYFFTTHPKAKLRIDDGCRPPSSLSSADYHKDLLQPQEGNGLAIEEHQRPCEPMYFL